MSRRAIRRHHRQRIIQRRRTYHWGYYDTPTRRGKLAKTAKFCFCYGCSRNWMRKHLGHVTRKEELAELNEQEQTQMFSEARRKALLHMLDEEIATVEKSIRHLQETRKIFLEDARRHPMSMFNPITERCDPPADWSKTAISILANWTDSFEMRDLHKALYERGFRVHRGMVSGWLQWQKQKGNVCLIARNTWKLASSLENHSSTSSKASSAE